MKRIYGALAAFYLMLGCSDGRRYDQAIGVLIDVSGTYADHRVAAVNVVKREILPEMVPGDSLLVVRIDGESYDRDNVVALLTLDRRPSYANAQKLEMAKLLDAFASREMRSAHTDIPGAMMLASEYLQEIGAGTRVMLVFSDMQEDLPKGMKRHLSETELTGTHVAAMNVKRLHHDSVDPAVFRRRLAQWEQRVAAAGAADWQVFQDPSLLGDYLEEVRSQL